MKLLDIVNKVLYKNRKIEPDFKMKNVLVVSNTGFGDTLLSIPAIKSLKKNVNDIKITFLLNKSIYPLLKDLEFVDDFIFYKSGFFNQFRIIKEIKKRDIDTIFLFHSNGPEDIFFSLMSGAKNILKYSENRNHQYKNLFINQIAIEKKHNIEHKLDLLKVFNGEFIDRRMEISKRFYVEKKSHKKLKIGLQLGSQDEYKIWPIENFIELANRIMKNLDSEIVIFGATKREKELSEKFVKGVDFTNFKNLCCKTSLEELAFEVRDLDLLITGDTGTMHLAIALETPTLSLFSPTNYKMFGPYQDLDFHKVIQKDGEFVNNKPKKERTNEGMKLISVDEVYNETIKHLKKLRLLNENIVN